MKHARLLTAPISMRSSFNFRDIDLSQEKVIFISIILSLREYRISPLQFNEIDAVYDYCHASNISELSYEGCLIF